MENIFSKKNDWKLSVLYWLYVLINLMFLVKYGIRQSVISIYILVFIFILFHVFIYKWGIILISKIADKPYVLTVLIVFFTIIYIISCNLIKNPYELNIDRWQTIEFVMDYWLKGKYIYDTRNFMGNFPSYLPGQLLMIFPFYLIGNVGYIQVAAFLAFCVAVIRNFENNTYKFLVILLFGISLSYIYEAVCKSDLISSFIIVSVFILFWHRNFKEDYFQKSFFLGILLGIICLTRSVVIIPLILFLFKPFIETSSNKKIKTILGFIISFSVLMTTVLLSAPNFDYVLKYNPLALQGQTNKYITLFFIVLTFILSFFYVKNLKQVFFLSALITFAVTTTFVFEQISWGYDLRYLGFSYSAIALPFCLIGYCLQLEELDNSK